MVSIEVARYRAALHRAIRRFFDDRGYLEVDPPLLAPELIPEAHIEVFATELVDPYADPASAAQPDRRRFLIPSPEIWMKRLLAQGYGSIYSLGRSFRNAESTSRIHNPEFTMLEWYGVELDYADQIELTSAMLRYLCEHPKLASCGRTTVGAEPERVSVAQAFERYAGVDEDAFAREDGMRRTALALDMAVADDESEEDLYQRILITRVEPNLPKDRPVFLTDYPTLVPTLARSNGATAERWELYIAGMEIANCYTEERDRGRLERFLDVEAPRKESALVPHPPATSLLEFANAPPCSGVALGFDRLLLTLLELRDITGVIFFA